MSMFYRDIAMKRVAKRIFVCATYEKYTAHSGDELLLCEQIDDDRYTVYDSDILLDVLSILKRKGYIDVYSETSVVGTKTYYIKLLLTDEGKEKYEQERKRSRRYRIRNTAKRILKWLLIIFLFCMFVVLTNHHK